MFSILFSHLMIAALVFFSTLSLILSGVESRYRERTEPLPSDIAQLPSDELLRIRRHFQMVKEFAAKKVADEDTHRFRV